MDRVMPFLLTLMVRALGTTWRYRLANWRPLAALIAANKPVVGAIFHGRLVCVADFYGRPDHGPWSVMVSHSRDGVLLSACLHLLGFSTVRGSSGRGGAQALVDGIRHIRQSAHPRLCMAVDGSRGPRYVAKAGTLTIASRSGASLICTSAIADRALTLKRSWDHTIIPYPWAGVSMVFSSPIHIPPRLSQEAIARLQPRLQALMDAQRDWLARRARRGTWR